MKLVGKYILAVFLFWVLCFFGIPGQIMAPLPVYYLLRKDWFKVILINIFAVAFIPAFFLSVPSNAVTVAVANVVLPIILPLYNIAAEFSLISSFILWVIVNKEKKVPEKNEIYKVSNDELTEKKEDNSAELNMQILSENALNQVKNEYLGSEIKKYNSVRRNRKYKVIIACISACLGMSIAVNAYLYYNLEKISKEYSNYKQIYQRKEEMMINHDETKDKILQDYQNEINRLNSIINEK